MMRLLARRRRREQGKAASIYDVQIEGGQEIPQSCGQIVLLTKRGRKGSKTQKSVDVMCEMPSTMRAGGAGPESGRDGGSRWRC